MLTVYCINNNKNNVCIFCHSGKPDWVVMSFQGDSWEILFYKCLIFKDFSIRSKWQSDSNLITTDSRRPKFRIFNRFWTPAFTGVMIFFNIDYFYNFPLVPVYSKSENARHLNHIKKLNSCHLMGSSVFGIRSWVWLSQIWSIRWGVWRGWMRIVWSPVYFNSMVVGSSVSLAQP